jgi:PhnB protein
MQLNPYLSFSGRCEEAMNYYKDCLSGTIEAMSYFENAPEDSKVTDTDQKKVMHSVLRFGGANVIMGSDSPEHYETKVGNNVTLSLDFPSNDEMEKVFHKLADGGQVSMPLQDTFWGARFGMCADKFGTQWMFNCNKR